MKSKRVIVYSLIGIVLFSIVIFIGFKLKDESNKKTSNFEKILEVNRKLEKENELSGGFPYTLEFLDYNITINSVKVFEDYAILLEMLTLKGENFIYLQMMLKEDGNILVYVLFQLDK